MAETGFKAEVPKERDYDVESSYEASVGEVKLQRQLKNRHVAMIRCVVSNIFIRSPSTPLVSVVLLAQVLATAPFIPFGCDLFLCQAYSWEQQTPYEMGVPSVSSIQYPSLHLFTSLSKGFSLAISSWAPSAIVSWYYPFSSVYPSQDSKLVAAVISGRDGCILAYSRRAHQVGRTICRSCILFYHGVELLVRTGFHSLASGLNSLQVQLGDRSACRAQCCSGSDYILAPPRQFSSFHHSDLDCHYRNQHVWCRCLWRS